MLALNKAVGLAVAIEPLDPRRLMDALPPTATADSFVINQQPTTNTTFTVVYSDLDGVDLASLGTGDITVTNFGGKSEIAKFESVDASSPTQVVATYSITGLGDSTLNGSDNGIYIIQLNPGEVQDAVGNVATNQGQPLPLGSLTVQLTTEIVSSGPLTRISLTNSGRFQVKTSQYNNFQFAPNQDEAEAGILIRVNTPDGPKTYGFNATPFTSVTNLQSEDGKSVTAGLVIDDVLSATISVSYTDGEDFARVLLAFSNASDTPLTFDVFFVAHLSVGDAGTGVGFYNPATGGIGGSSAAGNYNIIFQGDSSLGSVFGPLPTHVKQGAAAGILATPLSPSDDFVPVTAASGQVDPTNQDIAAGLEWKGVTLGTDGESITTLRTFLMGFTSQTSIGNSGSHVTAGIGAVPSPLPGETTIVVPVTYVASGGVLLSSLDGGDITVTGPNGFSAAGQFLSQKTVGDTTIALYAITGPAGGFVDSSSGTYTVTLAQGAVTANQGGGASTGGVIGSFDLSVGAKQGAVGTPDVSFGDKGVVQVSIPTSTLKSLDSTRQADGTILTAAYDATSGGLLLTRFLANGQLDTTFGTNGILTTAVPANFTPRRVQLDNGSSGGTARIYLLGAATDSGQPTVVGYDLNGNLAGGFGSGGVMSIPVFGPSDRVDSFVGVGGKLSGFLVGGGLSTGSALAATIVGLNSDGSLNMKFGSQGTYSRPAGGSLDTFGSITVTAKGLIYAAGTTSSGSVAVGNVTSGILLVNLASNGKVSKAFNRTGEVVFSAPGFGIASGQKVLVQPDGKILVTAALATNADAAAAGQVGSGILRVTAKGVLDTALAGTGFSVIRQPTVASLARVGMLAAPTLEGEVGSVTDVLNAPETLVDVGGGKIRQLAAEEAGANTTVTQVQVVADALDLVASVLTVSNKKPYKFNAKVSTTVSVSNSGTLTSPGTLPVQVFRSVDGVLDASDELIGTIQVKAALKPGTTKKIKVTASAPGEEGTYFLFAKVNTGDGAAGELALANNTAAPSNSIVVTATGKPAPAGVVGLPPAQKDGILPASEAQDSASSELFSDEPVLL